MMNRKTKIIKQALKEALLDLLEEQPLSSVSVRGLCKLADVSRSTFYIHYEGLNALVSEMEEDFMSHVVFFDGRHPGKGDLTAMEEYVHYVKENQRLFLLLLKNGRLSPAFISHSIRKDRLEIYSHHYAVLAVYSVYGTINALEYWLNNPANQTEREMAELLYRCACEIAEIQVE